ncbi:MAG: substrate-binding domain-containing protein, partial [Candidatus Tectomicrobia bacterium]|nr:substrate-binding domain-containing protein [Candidatus Tectomicrobia bacterium]
AQQQGPFVSRGDDSGTHQKERTLWQHAGLNPNDQSWYLEVGQGMGATLQIANDKLAYTLADRGTYLSYRQSLLLQVVHEGDPLYANPYSVIAVNPQRHLHVQYDLAITFINWLTSADGQRQIGSYRRAGQVLFRPLTVTSKP